MRTQRLFLGACAAFATKRLVGATAGAPTNENAAGGDPDGVNRVEVGRAYFFFPAAFFALVFPAAFATFAVFFFAAISAPPQTLG